MNANRYQTLQSPIQAAHPFAVLATWLMLRTFPHVENRAQRKTAPPIATEHESTANPLPSARPICGEMIVTTLAITIRVSVSADATARGDLAHNHHFRYKIIIFQYKIQWKMIIIIGKRT